MSDMAHSEPVCPQVLSRIKGSSPPLSLPKKTMLRTKAGQAEIGFKLSAVILPRNEVKPSSKFESDSIGDSGRAPITRSKITEYKDWHLQTDLVSSKLVRNATYAKTIIIKTKIPEYPGWFDDAEQTSAMAFRSSAEASSEAEFVKLQRNQDVSGLHQNEEVLAPEPNESGMETGISSEPSIQETTERDANSNSKGNQRSLQIEEAAVFASKTLEEQSSSLPLVQNEPSKKKKKGMKYDSSYMEYNGIFNSTCKELLENIKKFTEIFENSGSIPESILDEMRSALGQARLLMDSKLPQFADLLHSYLRKIEDPGPLMPCDLEGWWGVAEISIDKVKLMFDKLTKLESSNWIVPDEPKEMPGKPKRSSGASGTSARNAGVSKLKEKPKSSAGLRAFLASKRNKVEPEEKPDMSARGVTESLSESSNWRTETEQTSEIACPSVAEETAPGASAEAEDGKLQMKQDESALRQTEKMLAPEPDDVGLEPGFKTEPPANETVEPDVRGDTKDNQRPLQIEEAAVFGSQAPEKQMTSALPIEQNQAPKKKKKGMKYDASYMEFNDVFNSTCMEFLKNIQKFTAIFENAGNIPESVLDEMRSTLGQAHLLMDSKLPQFADLLHSYLRKIEDPGPLLPCDLEGWWAVAAISIDKVKASFDHLIKLETSNWIVPDEPKKKVGKAKKCRQTTAKNDDGMSKQKEKPKASAALRDFLASKRNKVEAKGEPMPTVGSEDYGNQCK